MGSKAISSSPEKNVLSNEAKELIYKSSLFSNTNVQEKKNFKTKAIDYILQNFPEEIEEKEAEEIYEEELQSIEPFGKVGQAIEELKIKIEKFLTEVEKSDIDLDLDPRFQTFLAKYNKWKIQDIQQFDVEDLSSQLETLQNRFEELGGEEEEEEEKAKEPVEKKRVEPTVPVLEETRELIYKSSSFSKKNKELREDFKEKAIEYIFQNYPEEIGPQNAEKIYEEELKTIEQTFGQMGFKIKDVEKRIENFLTKVEKSEIEINLIPNFENFLTKYNEWEGTRYSTI